MPCGCEFVKKYEDDDSGEVPWHYKRVCKACGKWWYGLHCPHDGYQNPCPHCGARPRPVVVNDDQAGE